MAIPPPDRQGILSVVQVLDAHHSHLHVDSCLRIIWGDRRGHLEVDGNLTWVLRILEVVRVHSRSVVMASV